MINRVFFLLVITVLTLVGCKPRSSANSDLSAEGSGKILEFSSYVPLIADRFNKAYLEVYALDLKYVPETKIGEIYFRKYKQPKPESPLTVKFEYLKQRVVGTLNTGSPIKEDYAYISGGSKDYDKLAYLRLNIDSYEPEGIGVWGKGEELIRGDVFLSPRPKKVSFYTGAYRAFSKGSHSGDRYTNFMLAVGLDEENKPVKGSHVEMVDAYVEGSTTYIAHHQTRELKVVKVENKKSGSAIFIKYFDTLSLVFHTDGSKVTSVVMLEDGFEPVTSKEVRQEVFAKKD